MQSNRESGGDNEARMNHPQANESGPVDDLPDDPQRFVVQPESSSRNPRIMKPILRTSVLLLGASLLGTMLRPRHSLADVINQTITQTASAN